MTAYFIKLSFYSSVNSVKKIKVFIDSNMLTKTLSLILVALVSVSECLQVLVVFETVVLSQFKVHENLFKSLAAKGHNVTVISHFPQENALPNYIDISLRSKDGLPALRVSDLNNIRIPKVEMYSTAHLIADVAEKSCEVLATHPKVISLLKEVNKYDVIFVEMFHSNCHFGITKKFKAPTIGKKNYFFVNYILNTSCQ